MEFKVYTLKDVQEYYHGDSRYAITAGAVLTVWDEGKKKIVYGPTAWLRVEEGASSNPTAEIF
jgi:hypothetical protein